MTWKRRLGIAGLVLAALLAVGATWLWYAKPWQPPVEVSDPGPDGRRVTDDGLIANYFPGKGEGRRPAILSIGGSEGGLAAGGDRQARAFAARGYAVLVPSYFRAPGQNPKLENIPLETFDKALAWLRAQPEVDPDRIAVIGGSKGAEAALLVATRHPELRAVVAAMPSSVVWAGVDWNFGKTGSSWSEAGKPLAFVPYGAMDYSDMQNFEVAKLYRDGMKSLRLDSPAIILVERVRAPLLLICGERDTLWPSCDMARQVAARAKRLGGPPVTLLAYADAGHGVHGIPVAADDPRLELLGSMGGTPAGNNAARADNWPKTLAFLDTALK